MGEANEKKERRFSQKQYDMLLRCSEKKDITEWNEWRKEDCPAQRTGVIVKRILTCATPRETWG